MDLNKQFEAIEAQIAGLIYDQDQAEQDHSAAIVKIGELQQIITTLRADRDNKLALSKELKKEIEEAKRERDRVKVMLETQANNVSDAFITKLDTRAKKFRWDKFIMDKQRDGAYRIAYNKTMLLGDEMGTGKTITSIAAADLTLVRHLLVLCPAKLASNFEAEFAKWAPHRTVLNLAQQTGTMKTVQFQMLDILHEHKKPTVLILNYESWARNYDIIKKIIELKFEGIIMDEAHHFKNKKTHAYQGIKQIVNAINVCAKCKGSISQIDMKCREEDCKWDSNTASTEEYALAKSMRKLILPMTGTFLMNSPADIWPALNIILPDTFDDEHTFLEIFATRNYDGKWVFKEGGADSLATQLGSKYIKRTMADMGISLPQQHHKVESVPLSAEYSEQRRILDQLAQHAAIQLGDGEVQSIAAMIALITRQRQAAADPNSIVFESKDADGNVIEERLECNKVAKLDYIESNVSQDVLFDGKRVAIFSQFSSIFPTIKAKLESLGIKVAICDGKTTRAEMDIIRQDFDRNNPNRGKYQVVLANFRAGGAGLNFTDIVKTYEYDAPWNPAMRNQAKARTRRIGQTEETEYIVLELAGTIDKWLSGLIERKAQMIDGFDSAAEEMTQDLTDMLKAALTKGVE